MTDDGKPILKERKRKIMTRKTAWRNAPIILNRQVQEEIFEFSELSEDVKNALIEERMDSERRYHEDFGYDFDFVIEDFRYFLQDDGFEMSNYEYDLSCCQGSGACFEGKFNNIEDAIKCAEIYDKFTEKEKDAIRKYFSDVKIKKNDNWRYTHKYTVSVEFYDGDMPLAVWDADRKFFGALEEKFEKALTVWKNDRCDELYQRLDEEMEYQDSEECARNYLEGEISYYFADGEEVA